MNNQFIPVYKVHEYLTGSPPSIKTLEDRVEAQKSIYLASILGVNCGDFVYTWYKKGPYSPALTELLYDNKDSLDKNYNSYSLREDIKEILEPLKIVVEKNYIKKSMTDWMELLASIHYLYYDDLKNKKINELTKELLSYKSKLKYDRKDIEKGFTALAEIGLIN
ncbi:hypothetical protein [Paenibacillus hunanensis]|uniref:Uncharacterized protein n=1 Tax=Paenibacillus hunanensis TaxID=539262 RepID=A0ABU1IWA0_9BACL|nr:hypothetical protein [Paenibacillus hunanensis]MDR6243536.1 hypothetical protein [Paenibacillus hunanensis]GGI98437.1 hypothetical protein GCM10008022_04000 [Paenibacillus hunanensis]